MESELVPVVLPGTPGLGVHCDDGQVLAIGVFDTGTGKRRDDVYQVRLFCGADPFDCEAEVITRTLDGMRIKRLRGKDLSFSLRIVGV